MEIYAAEKGISLFDGLKWTEDDHCLLCVDDTIVDYNYRDYLYLEIPKSKYKLKEEV